MLTFAGARLGCHPTSTFLLDISPDYFWAEENSQHIARPKE
jgi:hypothetical protein